MKYFDKFFDCLNVRCVSESVHSRKPDLRPYTSPDDSRLKVRHNDEIVALCLLIHIQFLAVA